MTIWRYTDVYIIIIIIIVTARICVANCTVCVCVVHQPIAPMPPANESTASAMLKRCSAVVASLQAGTESVEHGRDLSSAGRGKGIIHPAIQPLISPSTIPRGSDVSTQAHRQRTSVLEQLLTHGQLFISFSTKLINKFGLLRHIIICWLSLFIFASC